MHAFIRLMTLICAIGHVYYAGRYRTWRLWDLLEEIEPLWLVITSGLMLFVYAIAFDDEVVWRAFDVLAVIGYVLAIEIRVEKRGKRGVR